MKLSKLNFWRGCAILMVLCMALLLTIGTTAAPQAERFRKVDADNFNPVEQRIEAAKRAGKTFREVELFQREGTSIFADHGLARELRNGTILDFNFGAAQEFARTEEDTLTLSLPDMQRGRIDLELQKVNLFTPDFAVINSRTGKPMAVELGAHFRGVVKGQKNSLAAISIIGDEISGVIATDEGNLVLGKLKNSTKHVLYNDKDLLVENKPTCETKDDGQGYSDAELSALRSTTAAAAATCVRIYIEADFDVFQSKGANTASYLTSLFNQSATLYANESIPVSISQILVWTQRSPYKNARNSSQLLSKFQATRTTFNGDLGHLVALRGGGGIAAGFSGFCNADKRQSECFSMIENSFSNVPTYSWSVEVFTHEMGHLMGSRHTHACVWNGNNTAIDGCNTTEGGCPRPPIPSGGGTIMSYCHLQSVGINFNLGFGPQPGNVIRTRYAGAACLTACQ